MASTEKGPDRVILQLNRPALERLLGNDTELEVEIRHQIVDEFTKKHLRKLLVDENWKLFAATTAQALRKEVLELIGERCYDWKRCEYVAQVKDQVKEHILTAVKDVAREATREMLDELIKEQSEEVRSRITRYELKLLNEANEKIRKTMEGLDKLVQDRIAKGFEDRVQSEVQRRLKLATEAK